MPNMAPIISKVASDVSTLMAPQTRTPVLSTRSSCQQAVREEGGSVFVVAHRVAQELNHRPSQNCDLEATNTHKTQPHIIQVHDATTSTERGAAQQQQSSESAICMYH